MPTHLDWTGKGVALAMEGGFGCWGAISPVSPRRKKRLLQWINKPTVSGFFLPNERF